jgi:molecular chaperone HscA
MFLQIHEPGETPLPHQNDVAVGIDLGTTHSVIAVADDGRATVLHDMCGGVLIPSVVHYSVDKIVVGKEAIQKIDAIASIKRQMHQAEVTVETAQGAKNPVEISAEILKHLKAQAEHALGKEVTQAVITVPAYFDDAARTATRDAARLAGLEVLRLVNEPTAAALAYGLDNAAEGIYAIYDLGGGTFDISLLKLEKGVFQVLSTGGDTQLGGDDIDALISRQSSVFSSQKFTLLEARKIKETLSEKESFTQSDYTLTRTEFESLIDPLIQRTIIASKQAVADASVSLAEIKGVVLVGGSTRIPAVRRAVEAFFGTPPLTNVNPDEVVAVGAALQAEGLTRGSDNLLLDVIPLSLGLETMGEMVEKILHRNTPIPVSVAQEFTTYQDGQTAMLIHVLQGDREMVNQNRSLAKFTLGGIPPLPAGIARIKVTFTVDADGLLSVTAREEHTGTEQNIAVKPTYGLPPEEIEAMLLASMENAREDITLRLLAEARFEASRLIAELESAMKGSAEVLLVDEFAKFTKQIEILKAEVAGKNRDAIDYQRIQLEQISQAFAERRMDTAITNALKGSHINEVAE